MEADLNDKKGKSKNRSLWILRILLSIYAILYIMIGWDEYSGLYCTINSGVVCTTDSGAKCTTFEQDLKIKKIFCRGAEHKPRGHSGI